MEKTRKILLTSFTCAVILCIAVFSWLAKTMNHRSEESVSNIGMLYMSEMNEQMKQKFTAIIDLRMSQVEGIMERTSMKSDSYGAAMLEDMALSAGIRKFSFLGLYTQSDACELVYGTPIEIRDSRSFLNEVAIYGSKLSSGVDADGVPVMVLGVRAAYKMQDGGTSSALVAAIPMSYLESVLVLEREDSLVYSHVIREDGSYVIRTGDASRDNYFDRIMAVFQEWRGKRPEDYCRELKEAMAAKKDYSALLQVDGIHRHIYCSPLPGCDWYLVTVMPYGVLDDALANLGSQRVHTTMGGCAVVLSALVLLFILYYYLSRQQMKNMDKVKEEAVRANKAKSEFLSNMSHDIRTPMNAIVGMTAIALANLNDTARVEDCLKKITLSSKHLLGLINDVLDMAKIESGKLTLNMNRVSLREMMDNIVNIIQPQIKQRNQHFDIFIQDVGTEDICGDSVRLNQILINLLSNAVKFTPEEGVIRVYLRQEPSPKGDDYVRCHFRVTDSGIGMTEEFQKTIFDTFTREKTERVERTEGSGLGMAITKCIVDAMNGTIELKSAPGEGSEFEVTLDFEKAVIPSEEEMILPSWDMLVVDNNEDLCQSAVAALKEMGIQAESALNGETAVQMVKRRHMEGRDYQIVLLDWKMPEMDGIETTRQIRRHLGDEVPILIISAYDWSDIEVEARSAGVRGFISKPLFKSNLYLVLREYMAETSGTDGQEKEEKRVFSGRRILLAEDNDLNWEIAEDILSGTGFEAERAENGQICVEKFRQSPEGFYDAVLMDVRMPVMNGYEAARKIRAMERTDSGLPIIAMTADAFAEDIRQCLECGMNEHIAKPIDVDRLMQILQKYLG